MKCLICAKFCFGVLCDKCLDSIPITPQKRVVDGVTIYSFFRYDDVNFLMNAKYHIIGSRIISHLAKIASDSFFGLDSRFDGISGVGIDDYVNSFYSHTGVILKHFARNGIKPLYGQLRARNNVSYAGKPLAYRQAHKRDLRFSAKAKDIMIVDDIITTGTSFGEAIDVCTKAGAKVHFGIALCDAKKF